MRLFVALNCFLVLVACKPSEPNLPYTNSYPVSVAYWNSKDAFLVGTFHNGEIYQINGEANTGAITLQAPATNERTNALRVAIDEERNRLWVLDFKTVYIYRLTADGAKEKVLLAKMPISGSRVGITPCFPDLVLDEEGRALITNNRDSVITEVAFEEQGDRSKHSIVSHRLWPNTPTAVAPRGLSALFVVPGSASLLAADSRTGSLWRIERDTWRTSAIPIRGGLDGACAIVPAGNSGDAATALKLYVSRGFRGGIMLVQVSLDLTSARLLAQVFTDREEVFGLATRGETLVFPTAQLNRHWHAKGTQVPAPVLMRLHQPMILK